MQRPELMAIRQTRQHSNYKKIKASCKRTPENAEFVRAAKHDWYFEIDFSLGLAEAHLLCFCAAVPCDSWLSLRLIFMDL